ncbi:MAG: hypothetical protein DRR16_24635 [Candidatus Parabeggiatoa sp. nov. 3]|nr:MAG: hypothetical protein DRR00_24645 [Gammaproteobacteria bacterium]RKZ57508.1 MAG: hypothetical protein DRQ99_26865 [Gammaproteobacteria bacterium]RKZ80023.1 MAG: hypothetical protein DRR16_24635 [Gammaproteobacteria bacterium]
MKNERKIMLNIGCGPVGHPDWINIDYGILAILHRYRFVESLITRFNLWPGGKGSPYAVKWPENLKVVDARKRLPFEEQSVDCIFTSHFLEHVKKYEAIKILKESYRTLKRGGVIRVVVPNIDLVIKNCNVEKHDNQLKMVEYTNECFYGVPDFGFKPPTLWGEIQRVFMRGHQWLYDYEYMKFVLIEAGFNEENIQQCSIYKGNVPNLDVLEAHLATVLPSDISLYVEAKK